MRAIGIAIPFFRRRSGVPIDAQAQVHFNRVIADGGVVPSGLSGVNAFFSAVKAIYGTSDINTAISAAYDAHYLGYKLGAGSGTTLGQAAQKLYSATMGANLITFTDNLAQTYWVKDRATVSVYSGQDPIGTNTAYSVTATSQFGSINPTLTTVANGAYMIEFWARRDSGSNVLSVWANDNNTLIGTYSPTSTWTKYSFQFQRPLADTKIYPIQDRNASGFTPVQIWGINMYPLADVTQTTAASQPLLLAHTGENYWFGSGVSGNFVSTPNAAANQITGDIEIIAKLTVNNNSGNPKPIASKWGSSGNLSWTLYTLSGNLELAYSTNGTNIYAATSVSASFTLNTVYWIKCNRIASTGVVKFYKSTDGIIYTQIGTDISAVSGNLHNSNSSVDIGIYTASQGYAGNIYRATIANSIDGTPVVDFNPASYNPATSQSSWVSATSETWTINKSSGNTFVGVLVDRTIIQGNNSTTSMNVAIAGTQPYTEYLVSTKNGIGNYIQRATSNTRSHSGSFLVMSNGTPLISSNPTSIRQTVTYRNNGANSGIAVNNGTETTGAAGANNGTTLVLAEGAHNINTLISSLTNDSAPQRAAMFTTVKSFNNY